MDESFLLKQEKSTSENKQYNLSFEKIDYKENIDLYLFKYDVGVAIDTRGINYKELPEILFGSYDKNTGKASLGRPEFKNENVDMKYIGACIKEVSKESGINEFFMYPYGDDNTGDKNLTEQARMKLFNRYINLTSTPSGFGYILKIT